MRHPGIEPGPPRWQRGIIATRLMAQESSASTGNRTRATCLEGRNSNHWTIDARQQQDSNLRGQSPPDFKSGALTTRPYWQYMTASSGFSVGGSTFPWGSIFVKVLRRAHHRKSISFVDVYKGKIGKKKSYLLGLLAKIKCSICSYQLNLWYGNHCVIQ